MGRFGDEFTYVEEEKKKEEEEDEDGVKWETCDNLYPVDVRKVNEFIIDNLLYVNNRER